MRSEQTHAGFKSGALMEAGLYADLLSRFERLLAYASTLQARLGRNERQRGRLEKLGGENRRLKARIGLDDVYIALLEQALESAGVIPTSVQPASPIEATQPDRGGIAWKHAGERRLRLAGMQGR